MKNSNNENCIINKCERNEVPELNAISISVLEFMQIYLVTFENLRNSKSFEVQVFLMKICKIAFLKKSLICVRRQEVDEWCNA